MIFFCLDLKDLTGDIAYKEVLTLFQRVEVETYNIHVGDEVITTTDEHPFWVEGIGWVLAQNLKKGYYLETNDGLNVLIDDIIVKEETTIVYNFEVTDYHTYFVSNLGVWTHNECEGNIEYGDLDELGRATGVKAIIKKEMLNKGSVAQINPKGFDSSQGHARGPLLANKLGGSGKDLRNLVPIQHLHTNTPVMRGFENAIVKAVNNGETINFQATPIYKSDNPVPLGITINATGSKGFNMNISIRNIESIYKRGDTIWRQYY